jgi:hypothetical protein
MELVEIIQNSNGQWTPIVGDETNELLTSNSNLVDGRQQLNQSGQRVLDEAVRIIQACGNPNTPSNHETGLVIGYVQSGKTLSFTTVAALARDNNYPIVIVMAGTSVPLVNQSTERLTKDLRLNSRYDRKWILLSNPSRNEEREDIETTLAQWADPSFPKDRCRTVLITVMKHPSHLATLADLFRGLTLENVPTLIIDDEGDQASLNTRARQAARSGLDIEDLTETQVSATYRRINELRSVFPHHTLLQYTATPQANLFINIMDRLSPNFIRLLTPGDDYTGGIQFFHENAHLVRAIPLNEIGEEGPIEPPESLLYALKIFYLGVVAGEVLRHDKITGQRNRSMLVHPSRLQGDHGRYWHWVNAIKESWKRLLSQGDSEDKAELIAGFQEAYQDLQVTVGASLPSFETLTGINLIHTITYTPIIEVNSRGGGTPIINWRDSYAWILVGGQAMDRGFTVEGLIVTFMPRNLGIGNVDTTLQRARFFGYKRNYLGYCRIYVAQTSIDAYNSIIEHEENVREQLEDFDLNDKHLNEWDREVVLDSILRLTRANILYDEVDRDSFGDEWFRIRAPHDTPNYISSNHESVLSFLRDRESLLTHTNGHPKRSQEQIHLVAFLPLQDVLKNLLNKLRFTRESDSATYSSIRGIFNRYLVEHPDEVCNVYAMSARSVNDWTVRVRRLTSNDEIQQLFQGKNPAKDNAQFKVGDFYPGDFEIKDENRVSIQIHFLQFENPHYSLVPTLAIWIPDHMRVDIARQPDNSL